MPRVLSARSTRKKRHGPLLLPSNERWKPCTAWRDIRVDPRPPARIVPRVIFSSNINNNGINNNNSNNNNIIEHPSNLLFHFGMAGSRIGIVVTRSNPRACLRRRCRGPPRLDIPGRVDRYTLAGLAPLESTGSLAIPSGRFARPVENRELG